MFYSTFVLQKKGPFAKVWVAAHWDKKLTKADIKLVDITETVVNIVKPAVPMALRTSGELMLGVVRIYAFKVKFLLKEAQDATLKTKSMEAIQPFGKIDMPQARVTVAAVIEPEHAELDETLPSYENPFLIPDRSLITTAPPRLGVDMGDLDDWFQVPAEREMTFEESQREAFFPSLSQLLPSAREKTPSEVSSVVSSVERLRERVTPDRRREPEVAVEVPVEELDLFAKFEVPMEEAPIPEQLEVVTPAKEGEVVPEAPPAEKIEKPKKKIAVAIDKTTVLPAATMKQHLADTSDIVRQDGITPLDREEAEIKAWTSAPHTEHFFMPTCCAGLADVINDVWTRCVQGPEAEGEATDTERLRQPEGRPSYAPADGLAAPEVPPAPAPFGMEGEFEAPVPQVPEFPPTPEGRKRRAEDDAEARKRARMEVTIDLAKTVHDTLALLTAQFRSKASLKFGALVRSQPRGVVATRFHDLLVLKTKDMIDVKQSAPLAEITLTRTEHFKDALP
eukprot:EG_transcript_6638